MAHAGAAEGTEGILHQATTRCLQYVDSRCWIQCCSLMMTMTTTDAFREQCAQHGNVVDHWPGTSLFSSCAFGIDLQLGHRVAPPWVSASLLRLNYVRLQVPGD